MERKSSDVECAQQPRPHPPTGDLGEIAGINGQNSEGMCQGGKPGTGKLYTDVCLCCSAHRIITKGLCGDGAWVIMSAVFQIECKWQVYHLDRAYIYTRAAVYSFLFYMHCCIII